MIKSEHKLKHRNNNDLIKPILYVSGIKPGINLVVGINPAKGLFSIDVSCKFIVFTKNVNI